MKEKLKLKIEEWSIEKLDEYTHGAEIPLFEDRSNFIQEYDNNGLYIYNHQSAKFHGNDGSIMSLLKVFTDEDPAIYKKLYDASLLTPYNFYKLEDSDILDVSNEKFMYLNFSYPNKKPAVPLWAFESIDTEYMLHYIKFIEFIITTIENLNLPFPSDAINLNKLLKDPDTNEIYMCPIYGPNNWKFNQFNKREFLKEQMRRIIHHKQMITVDTGEEKPVYIDWEVIRQQTKEHWWSHKV